MIRLKHFQFVLTCIFCVEFGVLVVESRLPNDVPNFSTSQPSLNDDANIPSFLFDVAVVFEDDWQGIQHSTDYIQFAFSDVNIAFQTLKHTRISFRVSSMTRASSLLMEPLNENEVVPKQIKKNLEGQPIAWENKGHASKTDESIKDKFERWITRQRPILPQFDIAILILQKSNLTEALVTQGSICSSSSKQSDQTAAVAVLSPFTQKNRNCNPFTRALAVILGMPKRSSDLYETCEEIDSFYSKECGLNPYYFSTCSDYIIRETLIPENNHTCMNHYNKSKGNESEGFSSEIVLTMNQQCDLYNTWGYTNKSDTSCSILQCYQQDIYHHEVVYNYTIYPLTGTPCGVDADYCFRGRCIKRGYRLRNVATNLCLLGSDRFSWKDTVVQGECPQNPTPMERLIFVGNGILGTYLALPYSTQEGRENSDKCLSVNLYETELQFYRCSLDYKSWLEWDVVEIINKTGDYMFIHKKTKKCLRAENARVVTISENCDERDFANLWKFHELYDPPQFVSSQTGSFGSGMLAKTSPKTFLGLLK